MGGQWFRFCVVPGCFRRPHASHSRPQQPIMPTCIEEQIEVAEEVELQGEFYSPRIAEMIEKRKNNPGMDQVESEVEASKPSWSELAKRKRERKALAAENSRVFKRLQEQWPGNLEKIREAQDKYGYLVADSDIYRDYYSDYHSDYYSELIREAGGDGFFQDWKEEEWEVGEKIAEGGQAELFAAWHRGVKAKTDGTPEGKRDERTKRYGRRKRNSDLKPVTPFVDVDRNPERIWELRKLPEYVCPEVIKMFKEGMCLEDLQKLLPRGMLGTTQMHGGFSCGVHCNAVRGAMLFKGRFALVMGRKWGDLRKLTDVRMIHNNMRGPPFTVRETGRCLLQIAHGMKELHAMNITHGDLKAANVLVCAPGYDPIYGEALFDPIRSEIRCKVADYECSVGVVGTGFWRAPEILLAVKNQNITPELFTQASDVYSFGMTCYEIITGHIPYEVEGFKTSEYDRVTGGYRPSLPSQTPQWMKELLSRCWHQEPSERPTFEEILEFSLGYENWWSIDDYDD